jgi:protein Mpv17
VSAPRAAGAAEQQQQQQRSWLERNDVRADQVANLLLIASTAGLLTAAALTVDSDHWRGWTWFEVLTRLPLDNWRRYNQAVSSNPLKVKCAISAVMYALGEYLANVFSGRKPLKFDRVNVMRSALVGAALQAPIYHFYYEVTEFFFPSGPIANSLIKTAIDQTLTMAFWNAVYYTSMGLLQGENLEDVLQQVRDTAWPLLKTSWKLWPAAHIITYGFVPVQHRLLWVDFIEMVWCIILSLYRTEESEEQAAAAASSIPAEDGLHQQQSSSSALSYGHEDLPLADVTCDEYELDHSGSNGDSAKVDVDISLATAIEEAEARKEDAIEEVSDTARNW